MISGEEEFLAERAARDEARLALSSETCEFSLPRDSQRYEYESQVPLLDSAARAFVVWDAKEVPRLPDGARDTLIVVSKKPIPDQRAKRTLSFPKLKSYDDKNEVIGWILKEGESRNIDLSRVARALFVNSGNCLRKLASEIEKISASVTPGTVVSPEDARGLMCFSAELSPRDVVDAVCDGHTVRALAYYDRLQERNDETGWIIAYLQRHVIQHLRLDAAAAKGMTDDATASLLGVHPFIFRKVVAARRGLWTVDSLSASLSSLCELDLAHKRGDAFARFGLQSEIIKLCEEARNVSSR